MKKVVGIVQARMGSSRLPGKPLLTLGRTSALGFLIARVGRARSLAQLIVATSDQAENDDLVAECGRLGVECYRGSERDVLGRLARAARAFEADAIVRITGDDVLMDPAVVDFMVDSFGSAAVDCATGLTTRSFPNGFVLSVLAAPALTAADQLSLDSFEREHVIPAFLARRGRFRVLEIEAPPAWAGYDLGLTLDTAADYELLSDLVRRLGERAPGLQELLVLLAQDSPLRQRAKKNGHYWEPDRHGGVHRLSRA
jgi:spore coat polysaccharide biosynthesis protein SpsF